MVKINKKYLFFGVLTFLVVFVITFGVKTYLGQYNVYDEDMKKVKRDGYENCWEENITMNDFVLCTLLLDKEIKLDKKFLDGKCECEEWENEGRNILRGCDVGQIDYEPECGEKCSKYKCGNFIVK